MVRAADRQLPFFVYGTLRSGEHNWTRLLQGRTLKEVPAVLSGFKLYAKQFPCIGPAARESRVQGNLVYLAPELYDRVRQDLDSLEEYDPQSDSGWYLRIVREVDTQDETGQPGRVEAWIYVAAPETLAEMSEADLVANGDWVAYNRAKKAAGQA